MNARSLESRRRTPTKRALNTFWGMMCANDTRKIFHRSIEEKRYFDESRKERREKKTFHWERERERGFGENNSTKKLFCCEWLLVQTKLFVSFSFFSSSPAFLNRLFLQAKRMKSLVWTLLRNGLIERETITLEYQQLWPKERNRREKPRNRYDQTELLEETRSHLLLPFFFARF